MPLTETKTLELPKPGAAHPDVLELYEYWRSIAPEGKLPGRQHFDPMHIPTLLPNIWLLDVHRNPMRFWRRIIGSRIEEYAGTSLTNGWVGDRFGAEKLSKVERNLTDVVESKSPSWRRGKSLIHYDKEYSELERLYLPLAEDGETVDMILAISIFYRSKISDAIFPDYDLTANTGPA